MLFRSPSGQSSSDLNGVSDKEHKDRETKGEKPARDRSVQQPAGRTNYTDLYVIDKLRFM